MNRLAESTSAYLRTAADAPVHWWPWSEDAFRTAQEQDRPILLDIGAVWCHWCHVMDHGTYEDEEVVRTLNEHFVCIKVDRDERPDVDARYQQAIMALSGQGGWPLTGFLDHQGRPFYGGTYYPPTDAHGRPGFKSVLDEIHRVWKEERDKVEHTAGAVHDAIERAATASSSRGTDQGADAPDPLDALTTWAGSDQGLAKLPERLATDFDEKNGGWGGRPKFPHTAAIALALQRWVETHDERLERMLRRTLDKMADGGIHDHLMGGFHRYSVDEHWTVPHFEKMAYDNAELLRVFAWAASLFDVDRYRTVADGIVRWFLADSPEHGFLASQDADVGPHDDGDHFTWTTGEVEEAVRDAWSEQQEVDAATAAAVFCDRYGVEERGDMHHDPTRNVLEVTKRFEDVASRHKLEATTAERVVAAVSEILVQARMRRPKPFVDETRYTSWNAMCASAMLEAAAHMDRPAWAEHALKVLDSFNDAAWRDGNGWLHVAPHEPDEPLEDVVEGQLDDQVWMGIALVDAYRLHGREDLLSRAIDTARHLEDVWYDEEARAFADVPASRRRDARGPLATPLYPWFDQGHPGGNAMGALFLTRLSAATGDPRWHDLAAGMLAPQLSVAEERLVFAASLVRAIDETVNERPVVTVFGYGDEPDTQQLLRITRHTTRSGVVVHHAAPGSAPERCPPQVRGVLGNEDLIKDGAVVLVCRTGSCSAPLRDEELIEMELLGAAASAPGTPFG